MEIPKDDAMLLDIQYIKANRREGHSDYLYIIWKEISTGEKHLQVVPEPMMDIYFEKLECRNHTYNKTFERLENLEKKTVKYKDIMFAIIDDMGDVGRQKYQSYITTGNYNGLKEFMIYPYVFGADYDVRAWYRYKWKEAFDNKKAKILTKGYLDIETDLMEATGMPDPAFCPIDLVTLIDDSTSTAYTFALIGVGSENKSNLDGLNRLSPELREKEIEKQQDYARRLEQQEYWSEHPDELINEAHKMFDENYPGMEYKIYFYKDERKMLIHLFQLINSLKLDFIEIWNISFDIPYIMERGTHLGLDPKEFMCHPDFPIKECWFKKDTINFQVKNKADFFHLSSYTIFTDQMINYAAIRKGRQELRSNKLNYIAKQELRDEKLDYSEEGDLRRLSCKDWLKYVLYNIKDVLLQRGIERRTTDLDTYYLTSYANLTPYESEFKQTIKLRNVQYNSFLRQGFVPGENVNSFLFNTAEREADDYDDEDDEDENTKSKDSKFEGALVGNPLLISKFGMELFGSKTNSIFEYSIDMDMSRFYPSCIGAMNIEPSCLIFKCKLDPSQYDVRGGDIPFNGITDTQMVKTNSDSFETDVAKEFFDNFQTRNWLTLGNKWMNMPSVNDVYEKLVEKLG